MNDVIPRQYEGSLIAQRSDGYIDATGACKATGKQFGHYRDTGPNRAFLAALEADIGIPISELVQVKKGGKPAEQGTWVHPRVAMHLAQWCNPAFAVVVSGWCWDIATKGYATRDGSKLERVVEKLELLVQSQSRTIEDLCRQLQSIQSQPLGAYLPAPMCGEIVSVYDRCILQKKWPEATPADRRCISRRLPKHCENHGVEVHDQIRNRNNSPIGVFQKNVPIMDLLIEKVREERAPQPIDFNTLPIMRHVNTQAK